MKKRYWPAPKWQTEQRQRVESLLALGATYSQIASALGVTRNCVAGRVRRMRDAEKPHEPLPELPQKWAAAFAAFSAEIMATGDISQVDKAIAHIMALRRIAVDLQSQ
jgi:hypothetical protein